MKRQEQIRTRRRIALRVGLAVLVVLSATACIYETSTYQGGGRLDKAGAAKTAEATSTATDPPPDPTTTPTDSASPNPFPDAADGG